MREIREVAASSVIGEMLMIVLVLILVPMVTIVLMNQAPESRTPTVSCTMSNTTETLTLFHKGGDYLVKDLITVRYLHVNTKTEESFSTERENLKFSSSGQTYDLGDSLNVSPVGGLVQGDRYWIIAKNAVIFSGEIP